MDIQDLQSALFSKFQANPSSKGFLIMLATATVPSTYLMYSDLISWNLSPASVLLATVSQTEWYLRNDRGLIFVRSSPRWSAQRVDAFAVVVCNGLEWFGSRDWKRHDLTISRTGINWYVTSGSGMERFYNYKGRLAGSAALLQWAGSFGGMGQV